MRRTSLKRQALMRKAAPWRKKLLEESSGCDLCGAMAHCVHEIARGIYREDALMEAPHAVLVLCSHCHMQRVHGEDGWPIERQLALLAVARPMDLDLPAFNELRGRNEGAIVFSDILPFLMFDTGPWGL